MSDDTAPPETGSGHTVLCIDDEPHVLTALRRELIGRGYAMRGANSGAEAKAVLDEESVAAIICDYRLADENGVDLLIDFAARAPSVPRILLTAYGNYATSLRAINEAGIHALVEKPWSADELHATLVAAISNAEGKRLDRDIATEQPPAETIPEAARTLAEGLYTLETAAKQGHGDRVATLMEGFCRHLKLSESRVIEATLAARLHDVGEATLPESIQRTPESRLPESAIESFRRHPVIIADALAHSAPLGEAASIVRHHHERYDGKGFPDGLKGNAIPVAARMLAVIDVFDEAMHGHIRPRRLSEADARALLQRERGGRFDPRAVNAFLRWHDLQSEGDDAGQEGVPISELRPGMVLAKDLTTPEGLLLIPAGHRLSEGLLERVQSLGAAHGDTLRAKIIGGRKR